MNNTIKYCQVSESIIFFKNKITHYGLINEYHVDQPFVQFGLYRQQDMNNVINNTSDFIIVVWGGSDLRVLNEDHWKPNTQKYLELLHRPHIYHIAQSLEFYNKLKEKYKFKVWYNKLFLIEDLNQVNNFTFTCEKGNKVYIYEGTKSHVYNIPLINQIRNRMKDIEFITSSECRKNNISQENMYEIYKQCFIVLRLTNYDGNGMTVFEAGLCGIPSIHNGDFPHTFKWNKNDIDNIIKIIYDEKNNLDTTKNQEIQKSFINLYNKCCDKSWLNKNYYTGNL